MLNGVPLHQEPQRQRLFKAGFYTIGSRGCRQIVVNELKMRFPRIAPNLSAFIPKTPVARTCQARWLHRSRTPPPVPPPIPLIPDVPTFLTVIGRGLKEHANKFPSWEALFTLTSPQLKELGLEPPRARRYLLSWLQRYRKGAFGVGGDFKHVENGEAILKIASTPSEDRKWVVNVPQGKDVQDFSPDELTKPKGYSVRGARTIAGAFALPLKAGEGARVVVTEGMWEHKQGHKVDGGERRQAEVRFKKRITERRAEREAEMGLR